MNRAARVLLVLALGVVAVLAGAVPSHAQAGPTLPGPGQDTPVLPVPDSLVPGLAGTTGNALTEGNLLSSGLQNVVLIALIALAPFMLVMMTAFTRIVVVLALTRSALGTPTLPPTPVLIGLSLFLTSFVMAKPLAKVNETALQPWLNGQMDNATFFTTATQPLREFMLANVREKDLGLMVKLADAPRPANMDDLDLSTIVSAFVISELRTAFLIGFVIFVPFLVIDLVVSAVLSSAGMMMLPPSMISLPFKLLLFVAADGWYLLVESLVNSFNAVGGG